MTDADEHWMRHALALAEHGRGAVEPNPLVGAVVVRDGNLVGEGWHQRYGGPHAEVYALEAAGEAARGATLYVTLEPCCHHGKTPPCTDAIIRAGVGRVVAAMSDPFREVAGQGIARLRAAGVEVEVGMCREKADHLNAPYLTLLRLKRPYIHAKWAMSLDGKIATASGDSKWISGRESRDLVHRLRGRVDGILVGAGTVRADDPLLTTRPPGPRTPARIVLSSAGTLLPGCNLLRTIGEAPVVVATLRGRGAQLRDQGCEVIELPDEEGRPSISALVLELGLRRMTNILVEGGAAVFGSLCAARIVDEFHVFVAPKLIGGAGAPSPVAGPGARQMSGAWPLARWEHESVGQDVYLHGWTMRTRSDEPA
jgi:diaminohydroxyphosphoribosylaminopyrimidine deaminase/5-amino-6-(5-phosphoribosylamino)uracil reductase